MKKYSLTTQSDKAELPVALLDVPAGQSTAAALPPVQLKRK